MSAQSAGACSGLRTAVCHHRVQCVPVAILSCMTPPLNACVTCIHDPTARMQAAPSDGAFQVPTPCLPSTGVCASLSRTGAHAGVPLQPHLSRGAETPAWLRLAESRHTDTGLRKRAGAGRAVGCGGQCAHGARHAVRAKARSAAKAKRARSRQCTTPVHNALPARPALSARRVYSVRLSIRERRRHVGVCEEGGRAAHICAPGSQHQPHQRERV